MLVTRQDVLDAGGFDELYFFYFEDLEFCIRLRALGHRFLCEPRALAFHDRGEGTVGLSFRGTEKYPKRRIYLTLRHRWLTLLIHYRMRTLLVLMPALLMYEAAGLTLVLFRGWTIQWLRAVCWVIGKCPEMLRRRRSQQARRKIDDKALLCAGILPLAPGLLHSRLGNWAVCMVTGALDRYWKLARYLIA